MTELRGLYAINLSQPHLNDMEKIYRHTVDKGIKLLNLTREAAEAARAQGRDLHGQVHCA
jgi:plasmid stabilization system protein ParE